MNDKKKSGLFAFFTILAVIACMFFSIGFLTFKWTYESSMRKRSAELSLQENPEPENKQFLYIDKNSGFIATPEITASYEQFNDSDGNPLSVWIRIDRYGFEHTHEFSVDSAEEAENILMGLCGNAKSISEAEQLSKNMQNFFDNYYNFKAEDFVLGKYK